MKKNVLCLASLLLLSLAAVPAFAADAPAMASSDSGDYQRMQTMYNLSPEKMDLFVKINREYEDKMAPLMNNLWAKRTEINALDKNPNVQPATLSKLVEEMRVLREQLYTLHKERRGRLEKEVGIKMGMMGYHGGMGMMGMGGMGMGMGGMGMKGGCGNMGMDGAGMGHRGTGMGMYN